MGRNYLSTDDKHEVYEAQEERERKRECDMEERKVVVLHHPFFIATFATYAVAAAHWQEMRVLFLA